MNIARSCAAGILFAALGTAVPAVASDEIALCEEEIATCCSDVELGSGRLAACLYAHDASLSAGCFNAVADEIDILATVFESLRYARQECGEDLARLCAGVPAGQGRLISCLADQADALSQGCAAVVAEIPVPPAGE